MSRNMPVNQLSGNAEYGVLVKMVCAHLNDSVPDANTLVYCDGTSERINNGI